MIYVLRQKEIRNDKRALIKPPLESWSSFVIFICPGVGLLKLLGLWKFKPTHKTWIGQYFDGQKINSKEIMGNLWIIFSYSCSCHMTLKPGFCVFIYSYSLRLEGWEKLIVNYPFLNDEPPILLRFWLKLMLK